CEPQQIARNSYRRQRAIQGGPMSPPHTRSTSMRSRTLRRGTASAIAGKPGWPEPRWTRNKPALATFERSPFSHRHRNAEEVYVMLAGAGRVKLDDDLFAVRARDAIRVAPGVARAFEAGPDGLEFLAFGPHHDDDGEPVDDPWVS